MGNKVTATFYAVVEPKVENRYDHKISGRRDMVTSARVTQVLQKRPDKPKGVVVKLELEFNEEAFLPLSPTAKISIPDSMLQSAQSVEVEAYDENDQGVAAHLAQMARP